MLDTVFVKSGNGRTYNVKSSINIPKDDRCAMSVEVLRIDEVKKTGSTSYQMLKTVFDSAYGGYSGSDSLLKEIAQKLGKKYKVNNVVVRK